MKLYVCSYTPKMNDNIDGLYLLISEEGEILDYHISSNKNFAKYDLYDSRIEKYNNKYRECECLYLGDDKMTREMLLEMIKRNEQFLG